MKACRVPAYYTCVNYFWYHLRYQDNFCQLLCWFSTRL